MLRPFELEVMRDRLIYCMAIMDEKGRGISGNSRCLWQKDWNDLRVALLEQVNFVDQVRDREDNNG